MCKYKKWERIQLNIFQAEGNNGGDYIRLTKTDQDDMLRLEVGHCCVVMIDAIVPVEFITSVFSDIYHKYKSPQDAMRELWPTEYGRELAEKIKG